MDEATRRLPQGCQVEQPYTEDEWRRFVACATAGLRSGAGLHNEFYNEIGAHGVSDSEVLATVRSRSASLIAYDHLGRGRIAMWKQDEDLLVIGTEKEGLILDAFEPDDLNEYIQGFTNVRWLRR